LVDAIRADSESHFSILYDRYFDRIYGYVHRRLHNHADTEEIVQETFINVYSSLDSYRAQASLLAWMYGIARNSVNSHIRRAQYRRQKMDDLAPEALAPLAAVHMGSPEEQLHLLRYTESIRLRLEALSGWQVEIFKLRHVEDLSIAEIVERTGRSSDAVRSSLYRIKRLMIETASVDRIHDRVEHQAGAS
jgi:RNA polymerase sigma-70 factor (ECF subfamily)